ncbi:Hsp20/alpha crystallin family protein [Oleiagrimonas sp. C23AA]|uniref:Hsp20/alpha crystallin family protein n=1 Tax=Oleiagrimonas sp. C23AA TaxID=2719047 RepID=UPI0014210841|nr:Hsp20/alpha crystallin family protein [Oleiagrimonas sp. C23AA]NII09859.1 Hsp20/alpha crystallin family protein [Oleiagrimonas sp. C23AA]
MSVSQLIPWNRNRTALATQPQARDPFLSLHREVNRLFDDLWRQFDAPAAVGGMGGWPAIELEEQDKALVLSAELPGMDENDVEVTFVDQALVLRGERKGGRDDNARRASERFYGRFERRIPLDVEIEPEKAKAEFRNGVLTVTLPKSPQAQSEPVRIRVSKAA